MAPATTLNEALRKCGLARIDWLKVDTQGTDLRLFLSLDDKIRSRVLAVDVEPGLIDAYEGEDLFDAAHVHLRREGFWLSALEVKYTTRMRRATLATLQQEHRYLTEKDVYRGVRASPGWCEARYLRSIEHLAGHNADQRDYATLWCIAMTERQHGYALDIAQAFESQFGPSASASLMRSAPLSKLRRSRWTAANIAKRWLPTSIKSVVRRLFG